MHWLSSLLVALVAAVGGGGCGLFIGERCVRWYRISSFEGGSGYFVLGLGLIGLPLGFIVGLIGARVAAGWETPTVLKQFGTGMGAVAGTALVILALCVLFADPEDVFRRKKVAAVPAALMPTAAELAARREAEAGAALAALTADSPLEDWLVHTAYGTPRARLVTATRSIAARPGLAREISERALGEDAEAAARALRVIEHLHPAPASLVPVVSRVGQDIARRIETVNATPPAEDPSYLGAADVSVRFSAWIGAAGALRVDHGADFSAPLQHVLRLARVRDDSHALRQDVVRVASFYLHEWAGVAPLPGDPAPR